MTIMLSIIVVNWNVPDLLINTIKSILDNPLPFEYEIIVVDNASTDDSLFKFEKTLPFVNIIVNKKNMGFAKANNQGMEIARGKYILLLNPDTIVLGKALEKMIDVLETKVECGMVGPQLVSIKNQLPMQGSAKRSRRLLDWFLLDILYVNRIPYIGQKLVTSLRYPYDLTKDGYVEVVSGAAMMFKKSIIDEIGGLNDLFFMGGEDVEFCDRFISNNFKIYYLSSARIIHLNQSCTPLNPIDIFINRFISAVTYYKLKYGQWINLYLRIFSYIILIPKLLLKMIYFAIVRNKKMFVIEKGIFQKLLYWRYVGDAAYLNEVRVP